jgi:HK97 family phage portal protein
MGALERVNAALAESRALAGVPWRPWDSAYMPFSVGGPVHPSRTGSGGIDSALRLQPVYSSVRILAEGVAQLPWEQFRDAGEQQVKMPLGQLLAKPSSYLNKFDWKYQYVSSAALDGTAFGLITQADGYGYPTTVEWLAPDRVDVVDSEPFSPAAARFFYGGRPVPREDLLLVRAFTVPGRTRGVSVMRHFQMLIESGQDALAYGADWYKSGGIPPGVFANTEYEVEDEQAEKIRAKLVQAQRRRVPLVHGRDWTYTPINVPPDEAQFINAMQLNATQVAAIYGVPAHKVGGTTSTGDMRYSNVESEQIGFIQDTLDPWLVRLEEALAEYLPQQQYMQFNRDARLRMTPETRWNVYRAARDIGGMNVDEVRKAEGLKPLPRPADADDYDGEDYTPLQIQVAAARGIKEIIGEGTGGQGGTGGVETNPQAAPKMPAQPAPVPSANGNGRPRRG